MKIFGKSLKISISAVVFCILVILTASLLIAFNITNNDRLLSLSGSLAAGLIVAIIQFIIAWQDFKQTEELKKLELIKVMYDRYDRAFYAGFIGTAKREISIMGVTSSRLFDDFADSEQSIYNNNQILLQKLSKGIKVKILVPNYVHLTNEDDRAKFDKVKRQVSHIKENHPNYDIVVKYFDHIPAHSIFIVDNLCIVGPVFPSVSSRNTPSLFLKESSPMAIEYLKYFSLEWENTNE